MINKIFLNIFIKKAIGLIYKVYISLLKKKKHYFASTKTKSEVRGGGRKPWKQKGTGNARAGSTRSPLWKGGGIIFGPKSNIKYIKINKKEKKLAFLYTLYLKKANVQIINNNISSIDNTNFKILFLLNRYNKNLINKLKNVKNININFLNSLNLIDLLTANKIIISKINFYYYLLNFLI